MTDQFNQSTGTHESVVHPPLAGLRVLELGQYIAAPAAVRLSLPDANPTLYLTSALAITFPFNITIGLPIYFQIAKWLAGGAS